MVEFGVNDEGFPAYDYRWLDDGLLVPDATVDAVHRDRRRQVENQVAVGVEADRLGFEYVVTPEHHFYLQGATSTNPVLTQTAIAARTDSIRLLQMANILPWYEPVRLAEQVAMLDVISGGRAEVGVGTGRGSVEADVLGQHWGGTLRDDSRNEASFAEALDLLRAAWTDDLVSHHGEFHDAPPSYAEWDDYHEYRYLADGPAEHDPDDYFDVDGREPTLESVPVHPQPAQEPHPQLWRPAMTPEGAAWAARRGFNACCYALDFGDVRDLVDAYRDAAADAGWPDRRPECDGESFRRGWDAERRRGVAPIVTILDTDVASEETVERWKRDALRKHQHVDADLPPDGSEEFETDVDAAAELDHVDAPLVGPTEEIIDGLADLRETVGYEDFVAFLQVDFVGMRHDAHLAQLRSFAENVRPYFEDE